MQEANGLGGEKGAMRGGGGGGGSEREKREEEKKDEPSAVSSVLPQSVISGVSFLLRSRCF